MVKHVDVHLVDDMTGSLDDVRTVSFTYGAISGVRRGYQYEIELSAESRKILDELMMPYIEKGRRRRGNPSGTAGRLENGRSQAIREWAWETGRMDRTRNRGRLPEQVIRDYMEEHKGTDTLR